MNPSVVHTDREIDRCHGLVAFGVVVDRVLINHGSPEE